MGLPHRLLSLAFLIAFAACTNGDDGKMPANLIPEEQFVNLLTDMALAESAASVNVKNVPNHTFDSVYAFNPLLDHHIRKSQYDSTLTYYSGHIAEYKEVYEKVLENLSRLQAQTQSVPQPTVSK